MKKVLMHIKRRLYLYVAIDFIIALIVGNVWDMGKVNIMPISIFAVFLMLYPMLTGLMVEKVKRASKNYKLILSSLTFAFLIASTTAFFISRTILVSQPELAFAILMVGAIPCSNMLIGWSGIADASVEDALVIAVSGLLLIPFLSPLILKITGAKLVSFNATKLIITLLLYILVPLILGLWTRRTIIRRKGMDYFMEIKKVFPGISSLGVLLIVFVSVAKVAHLVVNKPIIFLLVLGGLVTYYIVQTILAILAAKLLKFKYQQGMILLLAAVASSQAISLSIAATMFSAMTVFALSFKPIIQVFYIMLLIYGLGPWLKHFLGSEQHEQHKHKMEMS